MAAAAAVVLPLRTADSPAPSQTPIVVGDHRSVELVDLGGPSSDALLTRVAANIGAAVDAVEGFWGTDWPHRIVVTATGSDRQFADLAGGRSGADPAQWSDVAAVAIADHVDPVRRQASGQQVVFAPGAAEMSTAALRIVLTHELFHYAARAGTAFDAPRWLTEGVADFVARPAVTPADRPASPLRWPSDADLDTPGAARTQAYDRAWWFAHFVAAEYGPAKLRELYLAACGPGHTDPPAALHRVLGSAPSDLLRRWQRWSPSAQS